MRDDVFGVVLCFMHGVLLEVEDGNGWSHKFVQRCSDDSPECAIRQGILVNPYAVQAAIASMN